MMFVRICAAKRILSILPESVQEEFCLIKLLLSKFNKIFSNSDFEL